MTDHDRAVATLATAALSYAIGYIAGRHDPAILRDQLVRVRCHLREVEAGAVARDLSDVLDGAAPAGVTS